MSRSNTPDDQRRDFYLYVDEFQNLATQNFGVLLAEARKYRLNMILTNQFVTQVPDAIGSAITGNVGTTISFRVGSIDAEYLERDFLPSFNRYDLMNRPNFHTYVSALVDGQVTKPFSMRIVSDFSAKNSQLARDVLTHSRLTYGRLGESVEKEIEESLEAEPRTYADLISIDSTSDLSLDSMEFSVRTFSVFKRSGISTLGSLARLTKQQFVDQCQPSHDVLREIESVLSQYGTSFSVGS